MSTMYDIIKETNIIANERLLNFVQSCAHSYIGRDLMGEPTTLADEMATISKMVMRADVVRITVDPYRHWRLAYAIAELTDQEKASQISVNYRHAGQKILWLNSVCRTCCRRPFIIQRVNAADMDELEALVDKFCAIVRGAGVPKA